MTVEVDGGHRHTLFNPAGIIFEIGCFSEAAGCSAEGIPTGDFSWFGGYLWCYALCMNCTEHLGWMFRNDRGDSFFGLILEKLISPEGS